MDTASGEQGDDDGGPDMAVDGDGDSDMAAGQPDITPPEEASDANDAAGSSSTELDLPGPSEGDEALEQVPVGSPSGEDVGQPDSDDEDDSTGTEDDVLDQSATATVSLAELAPPADGLELARVQLDPSLAAIVLLQGLGVKAESSNITAGCLLYTSPSPRD